jgi:phosphoribosylformimino-5-aminoimidazole carboxamide ribotide isomerase
VDLYPAIDVLGGRAVRLLRGDYGAATEYDADPVAAAVRWFEDGAARLHVVDLDGARSGRPVNLEQIERIIGAVSCPVQVGGGLRDEGAVEAVMAAGAERVVIGTAALRDPDFLAAVLREHGERVVVSLDARAGEVSLSGWTEAGGRTAAEAAAALAEAGVRCMLFTPIEVDGTLEGPGLEQLGAVAAATDAELIYSGGVGELADLRRLAREAASSVAGVIVGRALYERRFTIPEATAALQRSPG